MFKKTITFFLVFCILSSLVACTNDTNTDKTLEETVNFDLSQYNSHGTLSCGRIWCSKIEGDWDTPNKEYFAYFDSNGTRLSSWYRKDGDNGYNPADYKNNFVIIDQVNMPPIIDYYPVTILDINGDEIANLRVGYHHYGGAPYLSISEFSSEGIACCYAWDENYKGTLYWIDELGAHKFNISKKGVVDLYSPNSMRAKKIGDYIVLYIGGSYNSYTAVFNRYGTELIDVTEAIGHSIKSVDIDGKNLYVSFLGADGKNYNCVINFEGDFVQTPTQAGKLSSQNQNSLNSSMNAAGNIEKCTVPTLPLNVSSNIAGNMLETKGFKVIYVYEPNSKYGVGTVLDISPTSGTVMPYGSTITLYISSGTSAIKVGVTDFPPFFYCDYEGNYRGFDYELMQLVFSRLGMVPQYVEIDWSKKIELLNNGKIDCIWNALSYKEEYPETMSLTSPYCSGVRVEDGVEYEEDYVVAFQKYSRLAESVNTILTDFKNDGTISTLKKKYGLT